MKKLFRKLASAVVAATMAATAVAAVPVSAASTDAEVSYFYQMRCNNGKSGISTYTSETYYSTGYLIDIINGTKYANGTTTTTDAAELKTSAREYALMRIKLNSSNTESVNVEFSVNATSKTFNAYSFTCKYADWTTFEITDNDHIPNSTAAADVTYAASLATGYDWSQKELTFTETTPIATDTSDSDKLIDFTISITDEDNVAGYKDILIMNKTSDDDATKINVGAPVVTTIIKPQQLDLSGNTVYKYNVTKKVDNVENYPSVDNGEATIGLAQSGSRTIDSKNWLVDGDTETSGNTVSSGDGCAYAIDLGTSAPTITKLVFYNVSSSAIFGFADDDSSSTVGYLTDGTITLKTNWARLNNSSRKNLNSDITVTYGTATDGIYDTVTVEGSMTGRYLVFHGNGSGSKCSEIKVYISGDDTYEYTTPIMASYATATDTITPSTLKTNNSLTLVTEGGTAVDNLPETMSVTTYTIRIENYDATYGTPVLTVDGEDLQATVDSNLQNYYLATDGTTAYFTYQVYGATDYATAVTWNGEAGIVKQVA